jgi:hypothetical protein
VGQIISNHFYAEQVLVSHFILRFQIMLIGLCADDNNAVVNDDDGSDDDGSDDDMGRHRRVRAMSTKSTKTKISTPKPFLNLTNSPQSKTRPSDVETTKPVSKRQTSHYNDNDHYECKNTKNDGDDHYECKYTKNDGGDLSDGGYGGDDVGCDSHVSLFTTTSPTGCSTGIKMSQLPTDIESANPHYLLEQEIKDDGNIQHATESMAV